MAVTRRVQGREQDARPASHEYWTTGSSPSQATSCVDVDCGILVVPCLDRSREFCGDYQAAHGRLSQRGDGSIGESCLCPLPRLLDSNNKAAHCKDGLCDVTQCCHKAKPDTLLIPSTRTAAWPGPKPDGFAATAPAPATEHIEDSHAAETAGTDSSIVPRIVATLGYCAFGTVTIALGCAKTG